MLEKISSIIISIRSVFYKYLKMILFLMHHKLRSIFNLICFWTKRGNKQLYCFYVLNKSFSLNLDSNLICKWIKLFVTASVSAYELLHIFGKSKEIYSLNTSENDYLKWKRHENGSSEGSPGLWI